MQTLFHTMFRLSFIALLLLSFAASVKAQNTQIQKPAAISGTICDVESHPLDRAEVILEGTAEPGKGIRATTDSQGHFQFTGVASGTYTVRAKLDGYQQGSAGPFVIGAAEAKSVILHLEKAQPGSAAKDASAAIAFSDEPQFTVAGVTDTSALGVHASSRTMPNSNALAKDTAALAHATDASSGAASSEEGAIRARLEAADNADLRFQLAEIEEKGGHSLDAVKDYQRSAELAPTEAHLFGWGAELLLHRALEPAIEVFRKGHERYPQSARMLLGLGATYYAQGSRDEAAQFFLQASDSDPADPQPYLFLGRLLVTENSSPSSWTEKMKGFATLHPENAMAHYLYGLALAKQGEVDSKEDAEAQFNRAVKLDAHLGSAYLQLGILRSERKDFPEAVAALQKAVEYTPLPAEAHYRLTEVYRRMGDAEKARQETALFKQIAAQKEQDAERERHEIQQFIYTLRGTTAPTPTPAPKP